MDKPLKGLVVVEFSQFMAGPLAGLKLADMGARVIKVERPVRGEAGRQIAIKNLFVDDGSLVFHTLNRNKESYAANLKDPGDLANVKKLLAKADVVTHNFRPGVMEKIGLGYEAVKALNPRVVYAAVSGYGPKGPWAAKPGQDLLVQSLSGLTWLSGSASDGPVPFGLAVIDMHCASHLTHGILAALIKRNRTGHSVLVEVSLLESALDLQFEVITTHLNDDGKPPQRSQEKASGHAYLSAPYGIYRTCDTYLAIAMGDLMVIADALGCDLSAYTDSRTWFTQRDEIIRIIGGALKMKTTTEWLHALESQGVWCAEVLDYQKFLNHPGYQICGMTQSLQLAKSTLLTTRSPLRINGNTYYSPKPAPRVGEHTESINKEFNLLGS